MKTMYKVTYRSSGSPDVEFRWFTTTEEAADFAGKLGDRFIEMKEYSQPENYPPAELDFS